MSAPYTIWVNNGYDGWSPDDYDTIEELQQAIRNGQAYAPFRITQEIEMIVTMGTEAFTPPKTW